MKIVYLIVRILMGLLFVWSSAMVLFKLPGSQPPPLEGNAKLFMTGMMATGYLLYLIKVTEMICGILFLIGRFVPLATVMLFPITLNICLYHIFVLPAGLPIGIAVFIFNLALAYFCRKNYTGLVAAKRIE